MSQVETIVAADPPSDEHGMPAHNRRLSDKVLAAFNHAYAAGELEIAGLLRYALEAASALGPVEDRERRIGDILRQADHWVGFVEARKDYNVLAEQDGADPQAVLEALEQMRGAYKRWSEC